MVSLSRLDRVQACPLSSVRRLLVKRGLPLEPKVFLVEAESFPLTALGFFQGRVTALPPMIAAAVNTNIVATMKAIVVVVPVVLGQGGASQQGGGQRDHT